MLQPVYDDGFWILCSEVTFEQTTVIYTVQRICKTITGSNVEGTLFKLNPYVCFTYISRSVSTPAVQQP